MSRGVSDYLVAPFSVLDFIRAVSHLYHHPRPTGRPRSSRSPANQGRLRRLDPRPQPRLVDHAKSLDIATVIADLDFAVRHRRARLQPGPAAGHRGGGLCAGPARQPTSSSGCCRNAPTSSAILAAPATLDRLYDFPRDRVRRPARHPARLGALHRPRRAPPVERPGPSALLTAPTRSCWWPPRPRQPAQHQEPARCAARWPAPTTPSPSWCSTASAC